MFLVLARLTKYPGDKRCISVGARKTVKQPPIHTVPSPHEGRTSLGVRKVLIAAVGPNEGVPVMSGTARVSRLGLPATILVLSGFAIGYLLSVSDDMSDAGSGLDFMFSLDATLGGADAVVIGRVIDIGDVTTKPGGSRHLRATLQVDEVVYSADVPGQRRTAFEYSDVPEIAPGSLSVYEPLGDERASDAQVAAVREGEIAVFTLGFWDPKIYPDTVSQWGIDHVATIEPDGSLAFLGSHGQRYSDDLKPVIDEYARMFPAVSAADRPLAALVAWLDEKVGTRTPGNGTGSLQAAYQEYVVSRGTSASDDWDASPPSERYVDPETVPDSLSAVIEEASVFIEVVDTARRADSYLILQTPTGVVHRAHLAGGTHPAALWFAPEDDVVEMFIVEGGGQRQWVGSFTPIRLNASTDIIVISVDGGVFDRLASGLPNPDLSTRIVDQAQFIALVQAWQAELAAETGS